MMSRPAPPQIMRCFLKPGASTGGAGEKVTVEQARLGEVIGRIKPFDCFLELLPWQLGFVGLDDLEVVGIAPDVGIGVNTVDKTVRRGQTSIVGSNADKANGRPAPCFP